MNEAQEELLLAHKIQSKLLAKKCKSRPFNPNMLLVHAQDHLCGAQTQLEMAKEIISLYEQVQEIKHISIENFKTKNMRVLLVCGQGMSTSLLVQTMYLYTDEGDYIESSSFEELVGVIGDYDDVVW